MYIRVDADNQAARSRLDKVIAGGQWPEGRTVGVSSWGNAVPYRNKLSNMLKSTYCPLQQEGHFLS